MEAEDILKVTPHDINEVMSLIKEAIVEMERHNIFQWDEVYPDFETISSDIDASLFRNDLRTL